MAVPLPPTHPGDRHRPAVPAAWDQGKSVFVLEAGGHLTTVPVCGDWRWPIIDTVALTRVTWPCGHTRVLSLYPVPVGGPRGHRREFYHPSSSGCVLPRGQCSHLSP